MRYTQIFEKTFLEISVPFDFHPGISGIFGQLNGLLFGNSTISGFFWNTSREISVPFVPVSEISEFLVE